MPKPVSLRSIHDPRTLSELALILGVFLLPAAWWWARDLADFMTRAVPVEAVIVDKRSWVSGGRSSRGNYAIDVEVAVPDGGTAEGSLGWNGSDWDRAEVGDRVDVLVDPQDPSDVRWPSVKSTEVAIPWLAGLAIVGGAVRALLELRDRRVRRGRAAG